MSNELSIEHINTAKKLGVAIRRMRKQKSLSQAELARTVDMRQPTISDVENGRGTLDSFFKIIQALKINLALSSGNVGKQDLKNSKAKKVIDLLYD